MQPGKIIVIENGTAITIDFLGLSKDQIDYAKRTFGYSEQAYDGLGILTKNPESFNLFLVKSLLKEIPSRVVQQYKSENISVVESAANVLADILSF